VRIRDAQTGSIRRSLHQSLDLDILDMVHAVTYSRDGNRLASCSSNGIARVLDARSGHPLLELKGHMGSVEDVAFSPDGSRLATVGEDRTARVWDVRTGNFLLELKGHTTMPKAVAFSPGGTRLATAELDGTVRLWDGRPLNLTLPPDADELAYREWATCPDPDWHAAEAERLAMEAQWFAAAFHLGRLRLLQPERADLRHLALCQAAAGQEAARATCAELLRRPDPGLLWPALLRTDRLADPDRLLKLVRPGDDVTRAAILTRAGKYEEAAALLAPHTEPAALLYLALAEHGRGRDAAARQALERARQEPTDRLPWEHRTPGRSCRRPADNPSPFGVTSGSRAVPEGAGGAQEGHAISSATLTSRRLVSVARWTARIGAAALALFWGAFFVEHLEWFADPQRLPPPWVFVVVGLLAGWKWELAGAIVALASSVPFFAVTAGRNFPLFALVTAVPSVLWLYCAWQERRWRSPRQADAKSV
jgi:hypothetical protein